MIDGSGLAAISAAITATAKSNITISGITFSGCTNKAVYFVGACENVKVKRQPIHWQRLWNCNIHSWRNFNERPLDFKQRF